MTPLPPTNRLLLLLLLLMVSGCAPYLGPASVHRPGEQTSTPQVVEPLIAARQLLQSAQQAPAPLAAEYRLRAATHYLRAGQPGEAAGVLTQIDATLLGDELLLRKQILVARIALDDGAPLKALLALQATHHLTVSSTLKGEAYQLRKTAQIALGNLPAAVAEAFWLSEQRAKPEASNQQFIGTALMRLSEEQLQALNSQHRAPFQQGWIDFVRIHKNLAEDAQLPALTDWRARYPGHPARAEHLRPTHNKLLSMGIAAERIALLLPFSSDRLGTAARTIHAGFLAAYYATPATTRPELLLFDSASEPLSNLLTKIESAAVDLLIGPLQKPLVKALLDSPPDLPVLSLNQVDPGSYYEPRQVIQFGLLPEADTREAAQLAALEGHQRAAILASNDSWGQRLTTAFSDDWRALGKTLVVQQTYPKGEADYSVQLQRMLLLDRSHARKQALARALGARLQFIPRRRQDLDLIFLAAYPREGRLLQPQLRFFHASHVPLYATSHIWSGQSIPKSDRDLNGIRFCASPWQLAPQNYPELKQMMADYGPMSAELGQLFSFGMDAYRLSSQIEQLQSDPLARLHGATGSLGIDPDGNVLRTLHCAEFTRGIAKPLPRKQASEFDYGATEKPAPAER